MDIESTNRRPRVLVVDDHCLSRQYTVQALLQITRRVKEARNGREAVELALRFRPQLIFMDLNLPDTNGIDLLGRIREGWPDESEPPEFVILSGESPAPVAASEGHTTAFRVMTKPARDRDLQELALAVLPSPRTVEEGHESRPPATRRPNFPELFQEDLKIRCSRLDQSILALDWRSAREALHQMIAGSAICVEPEIERYCRMMSCAVDDPSRTGELSRAWFGLLRAIEQSRLKVQA